MPGKVVITDYGFADVKIEEKILVEAGYTIHAAHCKTVEEVLQEARDADALLVQWAPVSEQVISRLDNCKIIVRYGIGTDNVDLAAAREKGIPVCNVPDYCIDEVADHAVAMALALGRQLKTTEQAMQQGIWKIMPPESLPPFREMTFATVGFGRIACEVLQRAKAFKFLMASYDPYVPEEEMQAAGVRKAGLEELLQESDILSLHLPLNKDTRHLINKNSLASMKKSAILVNTSRGGLVDTHALAEALQQREICGAGLDVFEEEPLPQDHPLWKCPNAMLTSHAAWYSARSVPMLQQKAAEEVVRGLKGLPLKSRVN